LPAITAWAAARAGGAIAPDFRCGGVTDEREVIGAGAVHPRTTIEEVIALYQGKWSHPWVRSPLGGPAKGWRAYLGSDPRILT